jgi:hypothetical protein
VTATIPPAVVTSQPVGAAAVEQPRGSLLHASETLLAATVLLVLYVLPIWVFAFEIWRTRGLTGSWYFRWIGALAANSGSALTEVHQLLLPLVSGLSVVALRTATTGARWLAGFVLLNFVFAIGLDVALNIEDLAKSLNGFGLDIAALVALLRRMRETLLLYYAILVGVRLGSPETTTPSPVLR